MTIWIQASKYLFVFVFVFFFKKQAFLGGVNYNYEWFFFFFFFRAPQSSCTAQLMVWTMERCPQHRWGYLGWIIGKWVSGIGWRVLVRFSISSEPQKCVSFYCPTFCLSIAWTTGPFPVIKQEQLSPHSLSSQADNMSTQQASHDNATGRGRWFPLPPFTFLCR